MSSNKMDIAFFGSSLVSAFWNGAATYYRGIVRALHEHEELIGAVVHGEPERAQRVAQAHFALTYVTMEHSLQRAVGG